MTTFSLPRTLVAGTPENVNHVQENFVAVRDHINGNLDTTNFATSAKPSNLMAPYRLISECSATYSDLIAASGIYVVLHGAGLAANGANISSAPAILRFNPTDWAITGLTTKLKVMALVAVNGTDPGADFTFAMRSVTASGGAADLQTLTLNATHVTGSDFTISPGFNDVFDGASADFDVPVADQYGLSVFLNAGITANSRGSVWAGLYVHWV